MNSDSFIFYRSFYEAVKKIPKGEREELYEAIFEYALNGECYTGDNGVAGMVLEFVRPQIDANIQRRKNGIKGAEAGKKGGRPRKPQENPKQTPKKPQENPKQTPKKPQENPTKTPNVNVNDNVECLNDNGNDNDNDLKENISINRDKKETKTKFDFKGALIDVGVPPELVDEWLTIRKAKKAVNTKIAFDVIVREANKAGVTVAEAVAFSARKQYRGFEAQWYLRDCNENSRQTNRGGAGFTAQQMQAIVDVGVEMAHRWGSNRTD